MGMIRSTPWAYPAAPCWLLGSLLLCACTAMPVREDGGAPELSQQQALALNWLQGEWDNHAQVDAGLQAKAVPAPRIHLLYAQVQPGGSDRGHWLLTQHTEADDPGRVYQNRLYRLRIDHTAGQLRLERQRPPQPELLLDLHRDPRRQQALATDSLQPDPGCSFMLEYEADSRQFAGSTQPGTCTEQIGGTPALINTRLRFGAQQLELQEAVIVGGQTVASTDLHARKVRYFDGWAVLHRDGAAADPADGDGFQVMRQLRLHDQGNRFVLPAAGGGSSGYVLELAQSTYPGDVGTVLRLALLEERSGRTLAYAWASADASRIGLNLGWFQGGFTLKPVDHAIGWR